MAKNTVIVEIKFAGGMTKNAILRWIGFRLLRLTAWVLSTKIVVEVKK